MGGRFKGARNHNIYIYYPFSRGKTSKLNDMVHSGYMSLKSIGCGRELELKIHLAGISAFKIRELEFDIIELLKSRGFIVNRKQQYLCRNYRIKEE